MAETSQLCLQSRFAYMKYRACILYEGTNQVIRRECNYAVSLVDSAQCNSYIAMGLPRLWQIDLAFLRESMFLDTPSDPLKDLRVDTLVTAPQRAVVLCAGIRSTNHM